MPIRTHHKIIFINANCTKINWVNTVEGKYNEPISMQIISKMKLKDLKMQSLHDSFGTKLHVIHTQSGSHVFSVSWKIGKAVLPVLCIYFLNNHNNLNEIDIILPIIDEVTDVQRS